MSEYAQGGYLPSDAPIPERLLGDPGYVLTAEMVRRYGNVDAYIKARYRIDPRQADDDD